MPIITSYAHGAFCWSDLMTHDVAAAQEFYGGLFGWQAVRYSTPGGPDYFILRRDGQDVAGLGEMNADMRAQGMPPLWSSYVNVDDLAVIVAQIPKLGGSVVMPPMQVMEAGHMAILQDPCGAMLSLWQKNRHIGAQLRSEPGAPCWNELLTRGVDKAESFFGKLFGWEFSAYRETSSRYDLIVNRSESIGGMMEITPDMGELPPHWMVYFTVADADAAAETTKQLGGGICHGPFDVSVGRIVILNDPQGGTFSVIKVNG